MNKIGKQKNIQVIDGAMNCHYPIYSIAEKYFDLIFPNKEVSLITPFYLHAQNLKIIGC